MMAPSSAPTLVLAALLALAGAAHAQQPAAGLASAESADAAPALAPSTEAERQRIDRERNAEMDRQRQVEAACYQKFMVNDCLLESRVRHREVLADLKRQEINLNDRERRLRSSEQLRRIEEKVSSPERDIDLMNRQQQGEQKALDAASSAEKKAADAASQARDRAQRQVEQQRRQQEAEQKAQERAGKSAQAAEEARRFRDKLDDAANHRKQVEQDARSRPGPRGAPLPDPAKPGSGQAQP